MSFDTRQCKSNLLLCCIHKASSKQGLICKHTFECIHLLAAAKKTIVNSLRAKQRKRDWNLIVIPEHWTKEVFKEDACLFEAEISISGSRLKSACLLPTDWQFFLCGLNCMHLSTEEEEEEEKQQLLNGRS